MFEDRDWSVSRLVSCIGDAVLDRLGTVVRMPIHAAGSMPNRMPERRTDTTPRVAGSDNDIDVSERWMEEALNEARKAAAEGEVPVGAVIVRGGSIIGRGHNRREQKGDPLAHAEIEAILDALPKRDGWRFEGCTMYVTLEPCAMCSGALVNARFERLVFGALDPKAGFCGSLGDLVRDSRLNHRLEVTSGTLAEESGELLRSFFARLRRPQVLCQSDQQER